MYKTPQENKNNKSIIIDFKTKFINLLNNSFFSPFFCTPTVYKKDLLF